MLEFFLFVKQKTAYERRISDWSSDVCSSVLSCVATVLCSGLNQAFGRRTGVCAIEFAGYAAGKESFASGFHGFLHGAGHKYRIAGARDGGVHQYGVAAQLHGRSEEHTSELQSLLRISSAVFCLKKKK